MGSSSSLITMSIGVHCQFRSLSCQVPSPNNWVDQAEFAACDLQDKVKAKHCGYMVRRAFISWKKNFASGVLF